MPAPHGFVSGTELSGPSKPPTRDRRGLSARPSEWLDGLDELRVCEREMRVSTKLWLPEPPRVTSQVSQLKASGPVPAVAQAGIERELAAYVGVEQEDAPADAPVPGQLSPGSRWATDETGLSAHRLSIPPGTWLVGLDVRTAPHTGIVDLRLRYRCADGSEGSTSWAIGVTGGRVHTLSCDGRPYAMGVTVRSLPRVGLVNLRVIRAGGLVTDWAVSKVNGELHWAGLRAGAKLTGLELRAAPGYGIVDVRALARG